MAAGDLESRNIDTCQTDSDHSTEVLTKYFAWNKFGWIIRKPASALGSQLPVTQMQHW